MSLTRILRFREPYFTPIYNRNIIAIVLKNSTPHLNNYNQFPWFSKLQIKGVKGAESLASGDG
ncbi:hypothetical protein SiH_0362 [Sulfolobus islandicus HVE10/4]|uniref:Uncharacterized protein n=1 Tax=Saccharolobus islandicus (strain HVE10/4) TaxID=930943 RepID=F0NJE1_SACI0|nr:hypothetical protein SiH_0362 [Sulfolobus islandicus HVE10/4]